jgi:hypothetical protein
MKKLLYLLPMLVVLACSKDIVQTTKTLIAAGDSISNKEGAEPEKISVSCSGTCDCYLEGVLGPDESYVQCSCNDCVMNITFTYPDGSVQNSSLEDARIDTKFIAEFQSFMAVIYPNQDFTITTLTIETRENLGSSYLYEYMVGDEAGSVMYAIIEGQAGGTNTYEIDCTGSCDCRERMVWTNPPASECTCANCVMTVTEISTPE